MGTDGAARRRRRRRGKGEPVAQSADVAAHPAVERTPEAAAESAPRRKRANRDGGERGWRDLVGAGRSQLGVSGALRGRDANRPTEDDLAEAEREIVIVRRHWKPRE
jgi:hypothetical protein